jgi:hypothetical protein
MLPRMASRSRALGPALAAVLAAVALAAPALAADPAPADLAAARQLFGEGKDLEKQNAWADALDKFKKVAEVKMTPQVRFHMALCEENLGRLVSALNGFDLASEEARRAGSVAAEVAANAPARAEALRKRVPVLKISVEGHVDRSHILLDGSAVTPALLGTEIPVDPGAHLVEVQLDGKITDHKKVTLAERGSETVELTIDEGPAPVGDQPKTQDAAGSSGSRAPAIVAGAVGVVALGTAGVFWVLRGNTISQVQETCRAGNVACDPSLESVANSGKTDGVVAMVSAGVGLAGLATGGILWFALAPSKPSAAPQRSVTVTPTVGGLQVAGTF